MKMLKSVLTLLTALLCIAATSAVGDPPGFAPYGGWQGSQVGNATPPGGPPRVMELDPVDLEDDDEYPGKGVDRPGFGQWGPKDAGAQQPGCGHPGSGYRPPEQ